jgi:hypothetical protein
MKKLWNKLFKKEKNNFQDYLEVMASIMETEEFESLINDELTDGQYDFYVENYKTY